MPTRDHTLNLTVCVDRTVQRQAAVGEHGLPCDPGHFEHRDAQPINSVCTAGITLALRDLTETRARLEAWFQHRFGDEPAVSELRAPILPAWTIEVVRS